MVLVEDWGSIADLAKLMKRIGAASLSHKSVLVADSVCPFALGNRQAADVTDTIRATYSPRKVAALTTGSKLRQTGGELDRCLQDLLREVSGLTMPSRQAAALGNVARQFGLPNGFPSFAELPILITISSLTYSSAFLLCTEHKLEEIYCQTSECTVFRQANRGADAPTILRLSNIHPHPHVALHLRDWINGPQSDLNGSRESAGYRWLSQYRKARTPMERLQVSCYEERVRPADAAIDRAVSRSISLDANVKGQQFHVGCADIRITFVRFLIEDDDSYQKPLYTHKLSLVLRPHDLTLLQAFSTFSNVKDYLALNPGTFRAIKWVAAKCQNLKF